MDVDAGFAAAAAARLVVQCPEQGEGNEPEDLAGELFGIFGDDVDVWCALEEKSKAALDVCLVLCATLGCVDAQGGLEALLDL